MTNQPVLVLLVEDDPQDVTIARRLLSSARDQYEIDVANTVSEALTLMDRRQHHIILSDLGLPDSTGLDIITTIRDHCDDVPLVMLSGREDESLYVETLSLGADDFLCKQSISSIALVRCIRQNIERMRQKCEIRGLVEAVESQREALEQQAEQLQQKNTRLAALCSSAKSFVNNVSHEFRTPLCVIKQYSGMMHQGVFGEVCDEQKHFLKVMEDRVDGLNNLVDDMLDISRHESGLLAASRRPCLLEEVLQREVVPLSHRASVRDVALRLDCPSDLPEVFCDPDKVGRTLINLVVNAIKISSSGDEVVVKVEDNPLQGEVRVIVQDVGPGIDAKRCEELTDRFVQGPSSLLSRSKGFGLGLSIAKELVELNLGNFAVASEVGVGSEFSFTIPHNDQEQVTARYLERVSREGNPLDHDVSLINIRVLEEAEQKDIDDVERFLSYTLRAGDIAFPVQADQWIVMLNVGADELPTFLKRFDKELTEVNRNRPRGDLPTLDLSHQGTFHCVEERETIERLTREMSADFSAEFSAESSIKQEHERIPCNV